MIFQRVDIRNGRLLKLAVLELRCLILLDLAKLRIDKLLVLLDRALLLRRLLDQSVTSFIPLCQRSNKSIIGVFGLTLVAVSARTANKKKRARSGREQR